MNVGRRGGALAIETTLLMELLETNSEWRHSDLRHSELLLVSQHSIYMLGWVAVDVEGFLCLRGLGWFLVFS